LLRDAHPLLNVKLEKLIPPLLIKTALSKPPLLRAVKFEKLIHKRKYTCANGNGMGTVRRGGYVDDNAM
jgi:hypothetical protein